MPKYTHFFRHPSLRNAPTSFAEKSQNVANSTTDSADNYSTEKTFIATQHTEQCKNDGQKDNFQKVSFTFYATFAMGTEIYKKVIVSVKKFPKSAR